MMMYTGVRLSKQNVDRAQCLAHQLGVSRNKLFGLLIENAEVKSQPVINVSIKNEKSTSVTVESVTHALCESL